MSKYSTQNLYEASYLLAKGFKFLGKDGSSHKVSILFEDSTKLKEATLDFYNGNGLVSAKDFVNAYRSLKDLVFQR